MLYFVVFIILLSMAEGTPNRLKTILDAAPTHCFDTSLFVNNAGNNTVSYVNIDVPIPVGHNDRGLKRMEVLNLWMHIGRNVHPSQPQLMYIPGRTIIFDDFNKALIHVGITDWHPPHGHRHFRKPDGMALFNKILSKKYDSMVFRQHLDESNACDHHCCEKGSVLNQEMVALRGWNITLCPGHENLTWSNGPCDCIHTKFC